MDLRAYYFGNMYLSSIQQGIQAAHATADMFVKYQPFYTDEECDESSSAYRMLTEWASNHKTMILLNAGFGSEIHDLVKFFNDDENPYPFAPFSEEEASLDGAITTVSIILPEYIYEGAKQIREGGPNATEELRERGYVMFEDKSYLVNLIPQVVRKDISKWQFELICRLNNYGLAR